MTAAKNKPAPVYSVAATPNGHVVHINNAPLKTPAGHHFTLPTAKLAEAIVAEWQTQKEKILPATMPLTQLAATAIDIVSKDRSRIIDQLVAYVGSELLCHWADQPEALKQEQQKIWQPLLDWCALRFDALLQAGTGIMPIKQSPQAEQALRRKIESYDNFHLTGLRHAVDVSGSLVLGLALTEKHLTAEQVLQTAELDANFQMRQWGEDPDILKRQKGVLKELELCQLWLSCFG